MDFGYYLKKLRIAEGLTQSGLVARLNLSDQELQHLDSVTISRWERGITKPSISKSIKVLRVLTNDLTPYLTSLEYDESNDLLREIAKERFHSSESMLTSASYMERLQEASQKSYKIVDFSCKTRSVSAELRNFLSNVNFDDTKIFDIDVIEYQKSGKLFAKKIIDSTSNHMVGHSISFIFDQKEIKSHFCSPYRTIPYSASKKYNEVDKFAICIVSRFSMFESVYWILNKLVPEYISLRGNIHDVYFYVFDKWSVGYMAHLEAELVAYDELDSNGLIKVGKSRYRNGLYRVDSAKFLSKQEIYKLL
ncbi:helix-turn-helix domain-containing protein [Vibrio campbellii]